MNFNISGFVDIYGEQINKNITGIIDITDEENVMYTLYNGEKIYSISKDQDIFHLLKSYNLKSNNENLNNVKLQFIKGLVENNSQSNNRKIEEECITNIEGKYTPIVDDGEYSINIIGGKYNRIINNQSFLTNIPNIFYLDINGLIKYKIGGTNYIYNTEYRLINGNITNQNDRNNIVEIIISKDDKMFVKYITNEDGKYRFALKNGVYDVRIKSDKYFKLLKNINFQNDTDFVELIKGDNNGN